MQISDDVSKLAEGAMALSYDDRVKLIETVLVSLDSDHLDKVWNQETRNRLLAYRMNGIEAQDFSDYLKKYDVK